MPSAHVRPQLSCITDNLRQNFPPCQKNSLSCPEVGVQAAPEGEFLKSEDCLQQGRPLLYLFPRGDPDAPFTPLPTRKFFKTQKLSQAHFDSQCDCDYDSDSDSETDYSDFYESETTSDAEVVKQPSPTLTQKLAPAYDLPIARWPSMKSALKNSTTVSPRSPCDGPPSSAADLCETPLDERPRSAFLSVQIVEPVEEISNLHDLRKSFRYRDTSGLISPPKPGFGLPSSPKDGLRMGFCSNPPLFLHTPPAMSSTARERWGCGASSP